MSRTSRSRKGRMIDPIPETHLFSPPNSCRIFAWFLAFGGPAPMIGLVPCIDQDLTPLQRNSPQTFIPFFIRIKKKKGHVFHKNCCSSTVSPDFFFTRFFLHGFLPIWHDSTGSFPPPQKNSQPVGGERIGLLNTTSPRVVSPQTKGPTSPFLPSHALPSI